MKKRYEDLTFSDDFLFCKILEQEPELCKKLLELILGRKLGSLVLVNREKPIEITADGKGVRFDIYAEEENNTVYDVEMQNINLGSLPKRARYSQGMIDLHLMERGKSYNELNRSYIIFICRFNLFPQIGRHKYTFANLCREDTAIELGDETEKIFLCTKGHLDDIPENMKAFLNYVAGGSTHSELTIELENAVNEAKEHKRWRMEYMTLLEHYEIERAEGRAEGLAEGRAEGLAVGRAEGLAEGKILGIIESMFDEGKTEAEIISRLTSKYHLASEEAREYIISFQSSFA